VQSHDGFAGHVKRAASSRVCIKAPAIANGVGNLARSPRMVGGPPSRASGFASCGAFKLSRFGTHGC
jgi:hypothetical protein